MSNSKFSKKSEKGFTLIELLVVAAIIGILLAIAIPNLIKARMSANEANARKAMQTLRDAEGEFFEQDLNDNGTRDYTDIMGDIATGNSLRCPDPTGACATEADALVDNSFEGAFVAGGPGTDASTCLDPKAGYCVTNDFAGANANLNANPTPGWDDFGWLASMNSTEKTGRRDYGVYGDGVIRCDLNTLANGVPGDFGASNTGGYTVFREAPGCD